MNTCASHNGQKCVVTPILCRTRSELNFTNTLKTVQRTDFRRLDCSLTLCISCSFSFRGVQKSLEHSFALKNERGMREVRMSIASAMEWDG